MRQNALIAFATSAACSLLSSENIGRLRISLAAASVCGKPSPMDIRPA